MKSIKKFEKYELDIEEGEIAEEYAKYIISKYIDSGEDITLETVYADVVKNDELEEHADLLRYAILDYIRSLYNDAKKIRDILTINASKYNL